MDFHWRRVLLYAELEYQADLYAHGNCVILCERNCNSPEMTSSGNIGLYGAKSKMCGLTKSDALKDRALVAVNDRDWERAVVLCNPCPDVLTFPQLWTNILRVDDN